MSGWFARLMQTGARSHSANARAEPWKDDDVGGDPRARDARYDALVQMLRHRAVEDREAREKRQRWYKQHLERDSYLESGTSGAPARLHKLPTKVPCRTTPEGQALLDRLRKRFSGSTVSFPHVTSRQQAVMLSGGAFAQPRQIGWIEHGVQSDPKRCNVRHQGLSVETDGGAMLVLRFRHPATPVSVSTRRNAAEESLAGNSRRIDEQISCPHERDGLDVACRAADGGAQIDFTEIRPALDLRPPEKVPSPRLVWIPRHEVETMNALGSRDYEAFYIRFKLEVLTGIWSSLWGLLSSTPASQWHQGSCYTVVREPDAAVGKIRQRTLDDAGRAIDIGSDRIYDAFPATDILLLYLEGEVLADIADIYFTLRDLGSTHAYFLKEELFTVIRRFWAGSQSLASRYGSFLPAVVRMAQRAVPMPAQVPLLKQDWANLRQALVDRYGEGGRKAAELVHHDVRRPPRPRLVAAGWPFACVPAGEVNIGLRLVYRQEWRDLGPQRGAVIAPGIGTSLGPRDLTSVETIVERGDATNDLRAVVNKAVNATIAAMKWPLDFEGSVNTGARGLAARTDMGLEAECRETARETCARLTEIMSRMASEPDERTDPAAIAEPELDLESLSPTDVEASAEQDATTHMRSRLQNRYEVLTRAAELQNVVLVAEKLPTPAEIDLAWVRRHRWILAKVLLDESFRDVLDAIDGNAAEDVVGDHHDLEADPRRDRLYEHVRANILHYQRAIWQQEDPQQRSMRYRKSGKKVPLEWRFELEWESALTIDELCDRLSATNVDGQFAAYTTGRQADLDDVIDPAGPIGYYGNYAIYRMRPEFGSEDLLSVLHFFKSPYLRPNAQTGAPEVVDPGEIQVSEHAAVVAVSDRVIAQHRDEMFELVPELRAERGRARRKVIDGTDPGAVDRLEGESGTLRRYFAAYMFRRERTRQIVLDTDGVVIDVIRSAGSSVGEAERKKDEGVDPALAPDGCQLILDGERGIEVVSPAGHRDVEVPWVILRDGVETPKLLAGNGDRHAGAQNDVGHRIAGRDDGVLTTPAVAGGGSAHAPQRMMLSGGDEVRAKDLLAGAGAPCAHDRMILSELDDKRADTLRAGRIRHSDGEPRILARSGERTPSLVAGARGGGPSGPDPHVEAVLLGRADGAPGLTAAAGSGAAPPHERLIVVKDDEWLRPIPVAG